ncbi:hypothetical protein ACIPY0_12270 [Paenarthrobacter nicotinovorans]|uniref:hypothetical protein n=1 Tax=Paenarthrobacter nicotinovorans TaxID=29320 RepID=UPI00381CCFEA
MSDTAATTTTAETTGGEQQTTTATTEATQQAAATTDTTTTASTDVWDDPVAARAEIEKLRKQNGDERINAKKQAADEARQELLQKLGLVKGDEKPSIDDLIKQNSSKDAALRSLTVERALDKAARKAGADEDLLAAVLAHKGSLSKLDPSEADFATKLDALVKAELDGNPKLKAARAAAASGVELGGGSGEQGQITEQQLKTMTPDQIVEAQAKGLLRNLLG